MKRSDAPDFFDPTPPGHDTGLSDEKVKVVLEEIVEMGWTLEARDGSIYCDHADESKRFWWPKFRCAHCYEQAKRVLEEVRGGSLN